MEPQFFIRRPFFSLILLLIFFGATTLTALSSTSGGRASIDLGEDNRVVITPDLLEAEEEEESNIISRDQDEDDDEASLKFSWKYHQNDHSIYAHRSLMSTRGINNPIHRNLNEDKSQDDEEAFETLKTIDFAEKEWQLMFRTLDLMHDSVASSILLQVGKHTNLFEDVVSKLSPECRRDIYHIRTSIKKHKLWALRMVDSNGKLPSGISYGRFSSPGDYEECLSVRVDEDVYNSLSGSAGSGAALSPPEHHKFHGKYCLLDFRLPLPERPKNKLLSIHDSVVDLSNTELAKQFPQIKNYSGYASAFYEAGYMHGLCLPSTCEVTDLTRSLNEALEGLHLIVNNTVDCEQRFDEPPPLRKSQVISIILLTLLFLNAGCASIVQYMKNNKKCKQAAYNTDDNKYQKNQLKLGEWISNKLARSSFYPECFSIQTNLARLTKPDPRGLTFIHYTRIVAMALTVVTHTGALGTLQALIKPADTSNSEQIFRDLIPQMLANAFTSIQIFFFMAGFMLVISTYPSIQREKGHISFLEYAIKRAIRLMPGIAATICLNFLWPLIVDGPMLTFFDRVIVVPCEQNWWRTIGFLSNFDHVEKMCLRHSYFSASDYQLHIMAFPLLILLYKQPTLSLFLAGILTLAGFAAQVIMILTKTVLPFMMVDYIDKEAFFNVVHYIHHPCWNHMSAFFYGFIVGYLVVKQIRINLKESTIKRLWLIILPAGIVSIFAPYFWNHYKRPIYKWQMVLYVLIDRFTLLTTCAWLSYATMVLGRKPASKKPAAIQVSVPAIGSREQGKNEKEANPIKTNLMVGSVIDTNRLASSTGAGMPRQRSSPNFLSLNQNKASEDSSFNTTVRPAISSINVSSSPLNEDEMGQTKQQEVSLSISPPGAPAYSSAPSQERREPKKRSQAPISNVNTLCLILSRLTFQLYLFNMVVLWVDVNHSKYVWFFSYYFIITKAAAVYICSSLMAMVFFITLESPCLTLYIVWVKSRAQARASRSQAGASEVQKKHLDGDDLKSSSNQQNGGKISPDSGKKSVYDGICMKMGSNSPSLSKPTVDVIDLSSAGLNETGTTISQTKM